MVACGARTRLSFLLVGLILALGLPGTSRSVPPAKLAVGADVRALRAILRTPDDRIDLAQAKLVIDRLIDPEVDASATLRQVDILAANIKARFPDGAGSETKLSLLVTSLSEPGPWNDYRPFSYDLNDPFGKNIRNKLLSTYLANRRGNCVSMPILLVILAQKVGLNMTLAMAPEHVLAKLRNDDGQWINIEATSFGTKRDVSYQQELNISPKAIDLTPVLVRYEFRVRG